MSDKNKDKYNLPDNCPVKFHLIRSYYNNMDSVIGFGYVKNGDLHIPKYPQFKANNADILTGKELENSLYGVEISDIEKRKVRDRETWREDEYVLPKVYRNGKPYKMRPNKEMNCFVPVFNSSVYDVSGADYINNKGDPSEKVETRLRDDVNYRVSYFPVDYDPNKIKNPKPKYKPYVYNYGMVNRGKSNVFSSKGDKKMDDVALKKFTDKGGIIMVHETNGSLSFKGNFEDFKKFRDNQPKNKPYKLDFDVVKKQSVSKPYYKEEKVVYTKDVMYSKYVDAKRDPKNSKYNDYELYNIYGVFNPWDKRFKDEASKLRKE